MLLPESTSALGPAVPIPGAMGRVRPMARLLNKPQCQMKSVPGKKRTTSRHDLYAPAIGRIDPDAGFTDNSTATLKNNALLQKDVPPTLHRV